ncbi:MAG: cell division protein ZapB [Desulfuromonas sp.]|nr:MAG: cell division protein ZapB [Desulfuromonas sp.]
MLNDVVSRLEKKIDQLLSRQELLEKENRRLNREQELFHDERRRCREELDSILAKIDQLG